MTNKYNLKDRNSLIAAIIGWILLFSSCEIAWAKNECGPPDKKIVNCNESSYQPHQGQSQNNIKYKVGNSLELISEGLTLKTTEGKDNVSGIIIINDNKDAMEYVDMTLIWKSGQITTGNSSNIGNTSSVKKAGRHSDGLRVENKGKGATSLEFNGGTIHTYGYNSKGIHGWLRGKNNDNSNVKVTFSGTDSLIATFGKYGDGILGRNNTGIGNTSVIASDGTIETNGICSRGMRGQNDGKGDNPKGDVEVKADKLTVITKKKNSHGIFALSKASNISTVNLMDGETTTEGDDIACVFEQAGESTLSPLKPPPSGNATVIMNNGTITTSGGRASNSLIEGGAYGILALTTGSGIASVTQNGGDISTSGDGSHGIFSLAVYSEEDMAAYVKQEASGKVQTTGVNSYGLSVVAAGGTAKVEQLTGATISNTGKGADGISAISKNGVDITVAGSITGGRFGGQSVIANKGQHGVGIHVATGKFTGLSPLKFTSNNKTIAINIGETGVVNALSDKAIDVDGGTATITNEGTIIGTVSTWNQNDIFTNNAKWQIRNFQVSSDAINPDAIKRDTESVAVADFGEGDDTFVNKRNATVQLKTAGSQSEGTLNHSTIVTNKYFPDDDNPSFTTQQRSIREAGVEQAHIVNLERFENSGTITMADMDTGGTNPVAGDVMVITSSDGAATQGTSRFISNGGELHIDTVLDDGEHDVTDVLVVDSVKLSNKATALVVNNAAPDKGASTDINCNGEPDDGEGILVIYVRGDSDTDAFVLKKKLITGDWEYKLRRTDGKSWFLHSIPMKPKGVIHLTNPTYINDGSGISSDLSTVPDDNCQALKPVSYSYSLVSGEGDTDNDKVTLDRNKVFISSSFLEQKDKTTLSIRVQSKMNDYGFSHALTLDLKDHLSILEEPVVDEKQQENGPVVAEPAADEEPTNEELAADGPVVEGPVTEEPADEEPVADESVVEEPMDEKQQENGPVVEEPVTDEEPANEELAADGPVVEGPVTDEPASEEPVADESVVEEPVDEKQQENGPVVAEPAADEEPTNEELAADGPVVEGPVTEEPADEEPVADESVVEEPMDEKQQENGPVVEEPAADEEPANEELAADGPVVEGPVVGEEPAVEVSVAEETVSKGSNSVKTVSEAESGCCINNQVSPIINPIIDNNAISYIVERNGTQNTVSKDINTAVPNNKETDTLEDSVPDEADQSTIQTISNNGVSSPSAIVTSITDIDLSPNAIDEDKAQGTIIGDLSAVMTGDNQNISYRLVSGAGDTDNNKISISGNQLISTDVFDFERNSTLSIRVQAEISNGPLFEKELTIAITDTEADGCINHRIASNNQYSPLPFISSAYASNGSAVVSNISIFVWLFHCFALRFIYQSKKINGRWKRLFILGLTISLVACGSGSGQSEWQC